MVFTTYLFQLNQFNWAPLLFVHGCVLKLCNVCDTEKYQTTVCYQIYVELNNSFTETFDYLTESYE